MVYTVYDSVDNVLGTFPKWDYVEIFCEAITKEITVYVDTPNGFYEFPKKES